MQDFHSFLAPAKINLFLHITGQKDDGYHLLQTVFRLLDFYDTVHLKPTTSIEIKRINTLAGVSEQNDLCVRAAKLLQQYSGYTHGVEIAVDKKIPMGGGLGGGSSDAATVLLALNRLWHLNLSRAELLRLGLKLGADVPFFIFGSNAWAEGIGEQLTPINLHDAYYVVLTPNVHVSTANIFANKQLTKDTIPNTMSDFSRVTNLGATDLGATDLNTMHLEAMGSVKSAAVMNVNPEFINDLEKVVCNEYPEVATCLTWLKQFGDARMSGSGASVFLEVANESIANNICSQKPIDTFGFVAKGLNQHPLIDFTSI